MTKADSKVNDMKLKQLTLRIKDKSLSKKYKINQKRSLIRQAREYFIVLLIIFFLYTITDFLVTSNEISGFYKLGIIIFFAVCFLFTFTDYYQHIYQNFILCVICLAIFVKIILDWLSNSFLITVNTVLVSFISSCALNIDVIKIFFMNVIHIVSFSIKFTFISYTKNF